MSRKKAIVAQTKFERAQERVSRIRGFYNHAAVYVVVTVFLFLVRDRFTLVLLSKEAIGNPKFLEWIDWNVFGTALIWGVVVAIHGLRVFGNFSLFGKAWEEKQMKKFLQEEDEHSK